MEKQKDPELVDPSSITGDQDSEPTNTDSKLKESFITFQNKTNAQFSTMEHNFSHMTNILTAITASLADKYSCQNDLSDHQTNTDDQVKSSSSTKGHHIDDDDEYTHLVPLHTEQVLFTWHLEFPHKIPIWESTMLKKCVEGEDSL